MSKELMARIKYGDDADDAFAELVGDWQGRLIQFARKFVHDVGEAEDIAQDAFMFLWRCRHSYSEQGRFDSWLFRIVRNRAIDRIRSRSVDHVCAACRDSDEFGIASIEGEADDPLATVIHREDVANVMSAIDRLSSKSTYVEQQMVTLLSLCNGQDATEVASSTGLPLPTVKSQKRMAIEKLSAVII